MKTSSLYLRLIGTKVLQLIKKATILILALQGTYCLVNIVRNYVDIQEVPSWIDIFFTIMYWIGVVVLRACKDLLNTWVQELTLAIEHSKDVKRHKTELEQKRSYKMVEMQVESESKEIEANLLPIRKFHIQKISKNDIQALDNLIGLENVKKQLKKMRATIKYEKAHGGVQNVSTHHMAFYGHPGTGKTTVAKAVAAILYDAGIIPKPKYVAVNGNDLLGAYMGQTAPTINALWKQGAGGVIFIDEAYIIANAASDSSGNGYGQECVAQLLTLLEKRDSGTVVIFGGYEDRMEDFFKMNPGLRSRITTTLEFPDYSPEELLQITEIQLKLRKHKLDEGVKPLLLKFFADKIAFCERHNIEFSNGRFAENIAKELHAQHSLNYEEDKSVGEIITVKDLDFKDMYRVY